MNQPRENWRLRAKCARLTPEESDEIFFVKSGGKSKKAKEFCSDCPVIDKCLSEAISVSGTDGFWAGTTQPERERMALFLSLMPTQITEFLPPEPTARSRKLRPVPSAANPLDDPLYGIAGPSPDEERYMYGL